MDDNERTQRGDEAGPSRSADASGFGTTDVATALESLDGGAPPQRGKPREKPRPTVNRGDDFRDMEFAPVEVNGLTLRLATPHDVPEIASIYNAAVATRTSTADISPVSLNQARTALGRSDARRRPVLVAEKRGRILGYLTVRDFNQRPAYHAAAEVDYFVHPQHTHEGVDEALMGEAVRRSERMGVRSFIIFAFADNEPAIALARRLGFETWGQLPDAAEIDGESRDVLILGRAVG